MAVSIQRRACKEVWKALNRKGSTFKRGTSCETCGSERNIDAHHDDYAKPLDVRWLCGRCHAQHHIALKVAAA